jgi:uncharacterized cupin superfamily protein
MTREDVVDAAIVSIDSGEPILRRERREISILLACEEITITHARYAEGQQVASPHLHRTHTDAFYVLEGELTFVVGREAEVATVSSGGFVAVPPGVAHSFSTAGRKPARWLTIHARDGGFAAFMRGMRDGSNVEWDIAAVPTDGGLPASEAVVSAAFDDGSPAPPDQPCRPRCALPDLDVVEWRVRGPHARLPFHHRGSGVDSILVLEGELEATFGESRHRVGPCTLISTRHGGEHPLDHVRAGSVRMLRIHTPGLPGSRRE